ncbi:MAG: DEAD/DEAH box helicase [Agriterribacter sp.]
MSYQLLSEPIRRYIRDKGWEELRPIQAAAIEKILSTSKHYILASRTASGKTEAAFLPILSQVNFNEKGVQVLYVSPLIALINDQLSRIEDICKYIDVNVTKWHGEASRSLKDKIIKDPRGIVLITPESLEAMFVNKPYNINHLFSNLKYVVIDEIHSFIGSDRGIQLKSILSRLQSFNVMPFRIIGLSATIGDYDEAKKFTGHEQNTAVLLDKTGKDIAVRFKSIASGVNELSPELIEDLYKETATNKVLIFPNSRGKAEEIAVKLKKEANRKKGHENYFSHHSSVDKEVREYVEKFAKSNTRQNFAIACTSTLELGIDIGTVDKVIQVDATHSIASLIQRVGRSGRIEGTQSNLVLYATKDWQLLQALACWLLYTEKFIEPPETNDKPYDLALHQVLSLTKQFNGISPAELIKKVSENFAFLAIDTEDISQIIQHLIVHDHLEKLHQEVIIGVAGERIVNNKDFYSVFKTEENFRVVDKGLKIGEIPYSPQIMADENILLAAKIWKIKLVDQKSKLIEVIPAADGKKPMFFGGGANIHARIRQKMMEIIFDADEYGYLDEKSIEHIHSIRKDFEGFKIDDILTQRPIRVKPNYIELFSFTSTRINRSIKLLLERSGIESQVDEFDARCLIEVKAELLEFKCSWNSISQQLEDIDTYLERYLEMHPALINFSKWGIYLPTKYQIALVKHRYFDFPGVVSFIRDIKFVFLEVSEKE